MNVAGAQFRDELLAAGLANQQRGHFPEAEKCYRLVLAMRPMDPDPEALYRMGVLALQCANASGAIHFLTQAASVRRFDADGWYNLGMAHVLDYAFNEAQVEFERALALDPAHASAAVGLGNVHKFLGRSGEAATAYLAAVASPHLDAVLFSQLLVSLHTNPAVDAVALFDLHCEWGRRYAESLYPRNAAFAGFADANAVDANAVDVKANRRLRLGFVSPNLTANIVGHFLRAVAPPLARHADLYFYASGAAADWLTGELRQSATVWRDIEALPDAEAAALIGTDRIDILVDLAGHTPGHRLQLFARRPAPVQATWLDYFDTTGLRTMDVLITDAVTTPQAMIDRGAQRFVETVARLPHARLCYAPPPFAAPVAPLPSAAQGHTTFGCFGRADKIVPEVIALWSRILATLPSAKLLLKSAGYDVMPVRERVLADFERHGVARERIMFRSASAHASMLAEYADVDVALDTFPYNGGATTCDALLMGVPVVTLAGETMIARQGASLLQAAGYPQWIAATEDEYAGIACDWAADTIRLASTRSTLRPRLLASPLCDGAAFAGDLMAVFSAAWARWCATVARKNPDRVRAPEAVGGHP